MVVIFNAVFARGILDIFLMIKKYSDNIYVHTYNNLAYFS
jgi:hypothetical protein